MHVVNRLWVVGGLVFLAFHAREANSQLIAPGADVTLNTNATSDSGTDALPQVVTGGNGTWISAWHSDDALGATIDTDLDIIFARSTDNGTVWTSPFPLNANAATDIGADQWCRLATDGQGTWVAVWQSSDSLGSTIGSDWDILVSRSIGDGQS